MSILAPRVYSSEFPRGVAGFGLLLLRIVAGGALIAHSLEWMLSRVHPFYFLVGTLIGFAFGALVIAGLFTRIIGSIAALGSLAVAAGYPGGITGGEYTIPAVMNVFVSVALVCLGPGSFSVDARWFGPRELVISGSNSGTSE
jgi:hypothetical protein